jgi:hypothetical protein
MNTSKLIAISKQIVQLELSDSQNKEDMIMKIIEENKLNLIDMMAIDSYVQELLENK